MIIAKKPYREISKKFNGMSFTTIKKIKIEINEYELEFERISVIRKVFDFPIMYGYHKDIAIDTIVRLVDYCKNAKFEMNVQELLDKIKL